MPVSCTWAASIRTALAVGIIAWTAAANAGQSGDLAIPLPDFRLVERSGRAVGREDLLGRYWVAAFVFTRCAGPCTQVSGCMARIQHELAHRVDFHLVSFTVDPEHDTPAVLREYALRFGADPRRWLFLTGEPPTVYALIRQGFHLTAEPNRGADRTPGNEILHDTRLALVDPAGRILAYYDATNPQAVGELIARIERTGWANRLPALNAFLNGLSALLLALGFTAIRSRKVTLHKACMLGALAVSTIFLGSYLYYHFVVKSGQPTTFPVTGWIRVVYFVILLSHTVLAALAAPLAICVAYFGLRQRLDRHVRLARWTLPIWLYVSLTGVVVYWMLYHLYPPAGA